jgi:hypothetical protein
MVEVSSMNLHSHDDGTFRGGGFLHQSPDMSPCFFPIFTGHLCALTFYRSVQFTPTILPVLKQHTNYIYNLCHTAKTSMPRLCFKPRAFQYFYHVTTHPIKLDRAARFIASNSALILSISFFQLSSVRQEMLFCQNSCEKV